MATLFVWKNISFYVGPLFPLGEGGNASTVYVKEEFKSRKIHSWHFLDPRPNKEQLKTPLLNT